MFQSRLLGKAAIWARKHVSSIRSSPFDFAQGDRAYHEELVDPRSQPDAPPLSYRGIEYVKEQVLHRRRMSLGLHLTGDRSSFRLWKNLILKCSEIVAGRQGLQASETLFSNSPHDTNPIISIEWCAVTTAPCDSAFTTTQQPTRWK